MSLSVAVTTRQAEIRRQATNVVNKNLFFIISIPDRDTPSGESVDPKIEEIQKVQHTATGT